MLCNYSFTLSVLSLLVMGQAVPAHAADSCQPVFDALPMTQQLPATLSSLSSGKALVPILVALQ